MINTKFRFIMVAMIFGVLIMITLAASAASKGKNEQEPVYLMADKSIFMRFGRTEYIQSHEPRVFNNRLYARHSMVGQIFQGTSYPAFNKPDIQFENITCAINEDLTKMTITTLDKKTGKSAIETIPLSVNPIFLVDENDEQYWSINDLADILGFYAYANDGLVVVTKQPYTPDKEHEEQIRRKFLEPGYTNKQIRRMDASLSVQPYLDIISNHLIGTGESSRNIAQYTNTIPAYEQLIGGEKDLILVTEPSAEILALAEEKGVTLEAIPFAKEGFVFLVNSQNKVDSLRVDQLRDIYAGRITNWADIGGDNEAITAYQRNSSSGSQTIMESVFMKGFTLMEPITETRIEGMEPLVDAVAEYKEDGNYGIGYSVYNYAASMYSSKQTKLLAVDGVYPTTQSIGDNSYPLVVNYYAVKRLDDDSENTKKLLDFVLSDEGQKFISKAGLVPLRPVG